MMARFQARGGRLTPAAEATVDEYAERLRRELIFEAVTLSADEEVTPADIVNARGSLEARKRGPAVDDFGMHLLESSFRRDRRVAIWLLVALAALTFNLINGAFLSIGVTPDGEWWLIFTLTVTAVGVAALAAAGALLGRSASDRRLFMMRSSRGKTDRPFTGEDLAVAADPWVEFASGFGSNTVGARDSDRDDRRVDLALISTWIDVERDLRRLATLALGIFEEDARGYPMGELLRLLNRSGVLDDATVDDTRRMLAVRNQLVHANGPIDNPVESLAHMAKLAKVVRDLVRSHAIADGEPPTSGYIPYRVRLDRNGDPL